MRESEARRDYSHFCYISETFSVPAKEAGQNSIADSRESSATTENREIEPRVTQMARMKKSNLGSPNLLNHPSHPRNPRNPRLIPEADTAYCRL
jgi:hypothetical protein